MGMDGSVVIELKLERSRFDRDLRSIENLAPSLQVGLKLDAAKFKTDLEALQKTRISLNVDTTAAQASINALSKSEVKVGLKADAAGFKKQLNSLANSSETLFIPVEIDAEAFAQQLKKLEQSTLPIKIDLAPNVGDFQEKLRRLSRISPINIEIKGDKEAAFGQFEQIGKYAASGFAQGFSGTENAAKSAIGSLVNSVNQQLGIQSPSKVFREIGKYAIAGLMQGLGLVDESKLKGVVNKIQASFKSSKIKVDIQLEANTSALQKQLNSGLGLKAGLSADSLGLTDGIGKAVEKGVRNASKQNIFAVLGGGLLKAVSVVGGGILGVLLSPFKAIAATAATIFSGAGLKLGEELSSGVSSGLKGAIKNALGNSIGSGAIVGEALGEGISKAIGATIEALFPNILKNIAETSRQVLGEEKVFTAGAVTRSQSASKQQQSKEVATAQLQKEFAATVKRGDPVRARQLKSEIDAVSPQLQADSKAFASEFTAEQQRLQKVAEKFRVTLTPERLIKKRVKDYEAQVKRFENAIAQFEKQGDKQKATQVRVALGQLKAPDQDPSKISEKELRMAENLQVSKIRNRFVSRELNQKFGGRGAEIQRRNAELSPKIQEYNEVTGRIGTTAKAIEVLNVDPIPKAQKQTKKAQSSQPQAYKDIFQEVLSLSGATNVSAKSIPKLAVDSKLRPGVYGTYDSAKNQIGVSKEAYDLIQKGKIDAKGIEALVHELRHAVQFNFGKADVTASNKAAIPLLAPTPLETRELGRRIESSVEVQSPELQPISRKLEADAYVFAARNSGQVQQKVQKNNAVQGLESSLGIGGSKADLQIKRAQVEAIKRLTGIGKLAQEYGFDVQEELQISAGRFDAISQSITPILDKASNLEPLTAEEVSQLQSDLEASLSGIIEQIQAEPERLKSIVAGKLQEAKSAATTTAAPVPVEAPNPNTNNSTVGASAQKPTAKAANGSKQQATEALNNIKPVELPSAATNPKIDLKSSQDTRKFIKQNLNAQGTKDLARRMGIDTKNSNKEYLLNEIGSLAGTAANRTQIAQLIGQLSPDKFLAKSTNKNDSSALADAGKIISELKKARKNLADALKIAQELDAKERQIIFEQVIESSQEQEAIAKQLSSEYQLSAKDSKSLGGVKSQLGGITNQAKQSLAKVQSVENPAEIGASLGENLVGAIGSGMNVAASKPIKVIQTVMQGIKGAAEQTAEIKSPSRVFQRIGKFITEGLVTGIESGKGAASNAIASVMDSMAKVKLPELHGQDKLDARLAQLEQLNSIDPSIGADVASSDANKSKERRDETVEEIKRSPRKFIRQRAKNAVVQKARYITENAEQIAGIIGTKVGDNPTATQAKGLIDLQEKFGQLGEAATRFGEKKSNKNFQELDTAVKALEKSLSALGLPFTQINQEIDAYVAKLKTLQGEGKIDIEVDVESLAPEKFSFIDNLLSKFSGLEAKGLKAIGGLIQGFFAFQGLNFVQGFFTNIAQGAFKAFVELDRLKTSLNFSSGSKALGAQNLKFADNTADSLGIPLKESREGFTSLNAASRKTTLEGQGTRDLFVGMAQASTTLSLSTEQNQRAFQALTQILSKGKVSAEEMRGQLAESGLAGAMSIAARAIGVTDQEFNRLLESGQILSQDFLPKFAKQLQAEFGDAAQEASGNAQSAIYNTQNAFLKFQEGIGAGIAPAVIMGLNALAGVMNAIASISTELGIILGVIIVTLSVKMTAALASVIQQLILTKAAGGSLGGAFASAAQSINNSFSAKLAVGLFAALEIINLLSQAVNTNLVKSFDDAAKSAQRAAEESVKIKAPGKESKGTKPVASSGVGRFLDVGIDFLNQDLGPIPGGFFGKKITTYGQLEKATVEKKVSDIGQGNTEFLSSANIRLQALKDRKGKIGQLPGIDSELTQAEQSRQIFQAQMKRNYTDKGLAVPAELKQKLESQNLDIQNLNTKRSDIAKPFNLDITRADQQISSIKATIESLKSPEGIAAVGGNEAAVKLTEELKVTLENAKKYKADAESTLASLKVDPILAFTNALRKLNLAFAERQEQNQQGFEQRKSAILSNQVAGFSTNKFNSKQAAAQIAAEEEKRALSDYRNQQASANQFDAEAAMPEFQNTLQRLGVTKDSSAAKIDDVLKFTSDESDKGILEKLKAGKEQKNKLFEAKSAYSESQLKSKQANQDNSLTQLQDASATQNSAIQKAEAQKINAVKTAQQARLISESEAAEKIARISSNTTAQQQRSVGLQLSVLRTLFSQGKISAEEFHTRQRDLTDQQTSLEKQSADQRLAVFEATNRRKLEIIELANRKAEAAIQLGQTTATTQIKQAQLSATISPEKAAQLQNQVEQASTSDKADLIRKQIAETKQLRAEGVIDAKTATEKELQLNQDLAQSNQSLIDQQIQAQQQLRDEIDKTFQRRKAQIDLEKSEADVNLEFGNLNRLNEQINSKSPRDLKGLELSNKSNSLKSDRTNIEKQMALLNDQRDAIPRLKLSPQAADDKRRQNDIEFNQLRVSQVKNEQEQILTKQEIEINGIERAKQAEDNRHKQVISNLDAQKAKLDLINQSLELTSKLNESRLNLSKALSDATIAPLEIKKTQADTALGLSRRLDDKELPHIVRSAIKEQLSSLGMGEKELEILEKRSQIEDEIAAKKLEALKTEQEFQRQSLQLDLQRQRIAAEMATYEAEGAQLAAAKSKIEAQSALRTAERKKDDLAIESAKTSIELADKEAAIANKKLALSQKGLEAQDELASNAIRAQAATQRNAIDQQVAADGARKQASALEKVEATVKKITSKSDNNPQADQAPPSNWENPYIQKPGEDMFAYNLRINTAKMEGRIVETNKTTSVVDQSGFHYDEALNRKQGNPPASDFEGKPFETFAAKSLSKLLTTTNELPESLRKLVPDSIDKSLQLKEGDKNNPLSLKTPDIAAQVKTAIAQATPAPDTNMATMIVDGFKSAISGVEQRMDRLSASITALANTPRSLTVQSCSPVDDAASILRDIANNSAAAAAI